MSAPNQVDGIWRRLSFLLLPGCCVQCGARGQRGVDLCAACRNDLPWNRVCCARCALPLATNEALCGRCQRSPPEFDQAHCVLRYDWPASALITAFKFSADLAAGRVLSGLLIDSLQSCLQQQSLRRPDLLIPVPLHTDRLGARGFNQSLELSRPIAKALAIRLSVQGLQRVRSTAPQTGLTALRRRRNVRGAFSVNESVQGLHIALIDDVITTAATVRECARSLKRAGAASVQVWALARAPAARNALASSS